MKTKNQKEVSIKLAIVVAILAVVLVVGYFLFRPSTLTLAMELKLDVYNAIDSEISDAICNQKDDIVSDWAINIVDETLAKDRHTVHALDRDTVADNIRKNIKIVIAAGNIEKDGNELTDLSKSYVANAVSNAVSYSMPDLDMETTIDTGNTSYKQVLDIQDTLNHLKMQNDSLTNIVGDMNEMMITLGVDSGLNLNQSDVQSELDALQTQMSANAYTNKNNKVTDSDKDSSKVNLINTTVDMDSSHDEIIKSLQDALAKIKELSDEIDKIRNGQSSGQDSTSLNETITALQKQIEELRSSLKTTNDTICKDISTKDTEYKESVTKVEKLLETKVTELQTAIQTASEEERKALQDKVDDLNKLIEQTKKDNETNNTKITEKIDKDVKELSDKTDKDVKELSDKTDKSIQDLTDKTDKDLKELSDKTDKSLQDLTDKTDKDVKELSDKTAETIKVLSEETSATIKSLSDSTAQSLADLQKEMSDKFQEQAEETQKKFDEVNNTINDLKVTVSDLRTELKSEISNLDSRLSDKIDSNSESIRELQHRLERYMTANDEHSKIDIIAGFVIKKAGGDCFWSVDGSKATCVIANEHLKDSTLVDVDYAEGYDITPEYNVNVVDGTLTITIPADQVADITISEIVVYHNVTDDKPAPDAGKIEDTENPEEPEGAGMPEDTEKLENSEEIKANGNDGGDEYSSFPESSAED